MICNTGDAKGSDQFWVENLKKYNIKTIRWTRYNISTEDLEEGKKKIQNANKNLCRYINKYLAFLSKNWCQVKYSESIYASGSLTKPGEKGYKGFINKSKQTVVEGGTGYAVQMAIDCGKPVYFYNQDTDYWVTFVKDGWEKIENVPLIKKSFAGIGSTIMTENTKKALCKLIKDSFENT